MARLVWDEQNRDPQSHGPGRGRGLHVVGHFKKRRLQMCCCVERDVLDPRYGLEHISSAASKLLYILHFSWDVISLLQHYSEITMILHSSHV